ncbi:Kae1-associated serine/threonine protein kinase [Candidatus Bathyarchaeota archaeon]|nr:Kae1-associated serine/threonine protein kinase [Candidatus Bathyarchaeota archaeon]
MNEDSSGQNGELNQQVLEFCRHIAGSAQITAISLLDNYSTGTSSVKATLETVLVIRDFQPRLMSYAKIVGGRSIIFFAVDQWVFERDIDRGFLGEALAGTLIFPHTALLGKEYLHKQEILLKKRLILELLENLVLSFPELSHRLHIKPKYFMYEVMLNRVRIFPPLAYGLSNFMNGVAPKKEVEMVFRGYMEALKQLEQEKKIVVSEGYVMVPKKFVVESKNPKVRLTNISKNAPRTLFTSVLAAFPQLLNFFSQNTKALLKFQKFTVKREADLARRFVDPQKYVFVPTAEGLVSLADRLDIETFARKMLLNDEKAKIEFEPVGGVLNDVYLIKAYPNGVEKKVLVKRFKDWSSFKWFPLSLWSFGARNFAVLGRSRLEKECAISEFLRCEGINVPKILHVSHNERLVFMEYIEGENLSNAIKRIATAKSREKAEKELTKIERVGAIFAQVHALNVTLGDTKPENVIFDLDDRVYLLDFEQASHDGDKAWDVAVFLYYAGHYLQPLYSNGKAEAIAKAFVSGYLKGGGDVNVIKKAGNSKYTRIFSVFTMPSIMSAISNVCKKTEAQG